MIYLEEGRGGVKSELCFFPAVDLVCCLIFLHLEFAMSITGLIIKIFLTPKVGYRARHEHKNMCDLHAEQGLGW